MYILYMYVNAFHFSVYNTKHTLYQMNLNFHLKNEQFAQKFKASQTLQFLKRNSDFAFQLQEGILKTLNPIPKFRPNFLL